MEYVTDKNCIRNMKKIILNKMLAIKELVDWSGLCLSKFLTCYKQVKNLFKYMYIKRASHEIYIDCSI